MRKRIRQIMALASLCWMMAGCADEVVDRGGGKGEGRLILAGIDVESVVGDIQTKASLEPDAIPEAGDLTLTIVKADNPEEVVKTLPAGASDCFLPAGSYKVRATYGDEVAMSATPYFFGESEAVTITTGANQTVKLTASLTCAVLRPVIAPELEAQYESYSLKVTESAAGKDARVATLENGKDFFVRGGEGHTYTLLLEGTNKLGESASHTWKYENLVVRTRYTINCNPDLPAFTLPTQPEGNVWSKFIYITPMTADNMTAHPEMAEKVINQVVYEATADNGATWIPSEKTPDGRYVIKGLTPSTPYTLRSRFGGVTSSDTQTVTTESAQQVVNGDMETWSDDSYTTYGLQTIYLYYPGISSADKHWSTGNSLTMDGVSKGTSVGTNNQVTAYRWNSCTIPTTDAVSGNAAEIRTMALANFAINSGSVGAFGNRNGMVKNVLNSCNVYTGVLYTGTVDVSSSSLEPDKLALAHPSRPLSLSFKYKYAPIKDDECKIYAVVYDREQNTIAHTVNFCSNTKLDVYTEKVLTFDYTGNESKKAASIFIMFQSGIKTTTDYITHIEGSYQGALGIKNPWPDDVFVGSVLKIDNVTLNYDYE